MSVEPLVEPALIAPKMEPSPVDSESVGVGLARATTILAIGNITSRILGFAKEIMLSNYFGAGRQVDAFQIAITIPQDLYDLAISGHINSALVPALSEYAVKDREELWRLVSALLGLVILGTSGLVLFLELFAGRVVEFYRGLPGMGPAAETFSAVTWLGASMGRAAATANFSVEAFDLSVQLIRLTAPALIFMSLFAVFSGMLYALKHFTWPAFGAALFNGTILVMMVALAPRIGIEAAALGWVAGALAQLLLQFGGLRGTRLRIQVRNAWRHPGVRRIGVLYLPVLMSLIVDVLINRPFSYNMASQSGDGNIAYMNWATSLREFPMGLVGTAISVAILPTLARQALQLEALQDFKDTLGHGIRLALTLIIPATVGMFVLAGPLIGLVFEHGAFTAANTEVMSKVLRLYLLGIPFAAIDLLLIFAFYARKDSLTPALVGIVSLGCYIGIAVLLQPVFGFYSLMIADSAKHLVHMTISLVLLRRRLGGLGNQHLPVTVLKIGLATVTMALVTYALARSAVEIWPVQALRERLLLVIIPSALGGATYFLLASLLRLNEFTLFLGALTRRIRR